MEDDNVSVSELIQKISRDLIESEQARINRGQRAVFEVSELTIDISFVVSRSRQGQAGIDLHVVKVGGEVGRGDERTQRMTLKLISASGSAKRESTPEFASLDYDDQLPVRPRLRDRAE